jgi:3-mercaptopyruvate sulfurtransferase SseA
VVSGAGLTPDSALAFLILEQLGQNKVSILSNSMDDWSKLGFTLSKEPTLVGAPKSPQGMAVPPTVYSPVARRDAMITDPKTTRGVYPKVFIASGKTAPASSVEGTVLHVAYTDLVDETGAPKSAKEIWKTLAKAGVPRYAELVCFADDPAEAAVNYFILKMMGYPDVKVWVSRTERS